MRRSSAFAALVVLAGCSGGPSVFTPAAAPGALLDIWPGLDGGVEAASQGEECTRSYGSYFADFGVRGLACSSGQVVPPTTVVARAPVAPFLSGPHRMSDRAVDFNLTAETAFGHYDPAFVRWAIEAGIPDGEAGRILAQPIYDRHIARIARIYWLTYDDLAADGFPSSVPVGPLEAYARFLNGGPIPDGMEGYEGGFSVFAFTDRSEGLLPRIGLRLDNDWTAKYEANTAYGFWIRRRADGTRGLWLDGLRDLLSTFDASWLAAHGG